jgi:hypothetical protein
VGDDFDFGGRRSAGFCWRSGRLELDELGRSGFGHVLGSFGEEASEESWI